MDAQDKAAAEVEFDPRAAGGPFSGGRAEREFNELHGIDSISAGGRATSPGDEGLVAKAAVAAESGGAAAARVELPEQAGLVFIGVTCS